MPNMYSHLPNGGWIMSISYFDSGWHRVATGLDVEVQHGIPLHLSKTATANYDDASIINNVYALTGLTITTDNWIEHENDEQISSVCINKAEFTEVLRRLAVASAAIYVDRFHKAIDRSAVDWDSAQFTFDFNHAIQYCCIPWGTLNKDNYFAEYITTMHDESNRLINQGISPLVEAE